MLNLVQLEKNKQAKAKEAQALLTTTMQTAEAENRQMTPEETAAIEVLASEARAIRDQIDKAKGVQNLNAELDALLQASGTASQKPTVQKTIGQQWVESDAMEFIRKGGHRAQSAWRSPSAELYLATTLTEDPASGGKLVLPQYLPGIQPILQRRLVVGDLFASGTTDSNQIAYMQESLFTNAAAAVLEGGIKPESALAFTAVTDPVRKIAHWLPVTEEMLEDVAQIRSYIDARLVLGVQLEEEDQLMNGDGVAPNLLGILKRPGLAADVVRTNPANNADAIFQQAMAIFASSYLMPDGVVMNPADWATTALMKTADGSYLTAGPFAPIQTPTLWGLPIAVTPMITVATALVGAFKQGAQIFRKGGIRVEASNSHADFFIKNLVAIRAEERLALAVYRPQAFGEVTGLGPAGPAALGAAGGGTRTPNGERTPNGDRK